MGSVRLRDFPFVFWVVNVMELFERAAYYGLNSVLAVYLTAEVTKGGLGFDPQAVGFLQGSIFAAVYVIPILGGALADRYGYRRMLLVAFALLAVGYFASGRAHSYLLVFGCLFVMAVGAGLFKPIISGTIARSTDERTSSFGFAIFYWTINLGALIAPLVVSWLKGISWQAVFTASAVYTGAMILPTLLLYREPPKPASKKTLSQSLLGAAEVLGDARFMLMIVVYSGFWILYFQNFSTVLWYLDDFVAKGPVDAVVNGGLATLGIGATFQFDAEHVTTINALTIILLQFLVSRLVKDRPALTTMITGMGIGAVGFLLLASSQNPWIFILGITVFSIGEMTAHPKYISLVGLIAPADRKAVYMGYAFLYGVFGALLGSNIGALAYKAVLKPLVGAADAGGTIAWFWGAFAVLDVGAALGLYAFARFLGTDTDGTRRKARTIMTTIYGVLLAAGLGFVLLAVTATPMQPKTLVQALLFVALGIGGLVITGRGNRGAEAPATTDSAKR
ncbi:MAG: MFS transporter [Deltaproteobacteria bacterium]|nr:MFS transporter [Deltaproteobacteria bacterium]